jgi:cytochrome c551/c552
MSRFNKGLRACALALLTVTAATAASAANFAGIGRSATEKEVSAWDIDVRPDFKGLPKGSGSVTKGMAVWDARCASCHGSFGESNEVFTPIIGGTRPDDIKTGRVAALAGNSQPQRTTLMKLSTVSTLWDYINRSMPWNEPKSLSVEEVYAVTAYILNMGEIVPDDFVLSDQNIGAVQARLPNRNGMSTKHGLWDLRGKPDVRSKACMKDCPATTTISSSLPASAHGAHGNLAEQNRSFGPVRGMPLVAAAAAPAKPASPPAAAAGGALKLAQQYACVACHGVTNRLVGPSFSEVAAKYKGDANAESRLLGKMRQGGAGVWGQVPMPPQGQVPEADLRALVQWILKPGS